MMLFDSQKMAKATETGSEIAAIKTQPEPNFLIIRAPEIPATTVRAAKIAETEAITDGTAREGKELNMPVLAAE